MITGPTSVVLLGTAVPIRTLVTLLQGQSDLMIVDKTGFDSLIDVHLDFSQNRAAVPLPDAPDSGSSGAGLAAQSELSPSLVTAIQEIGLKLESGRTHLEVLVIDSVQRPSEN